MATTQGSGKRLRWQLADDSAPAPPLIADPPPRIRHPEFAGMEFLHVRAKRIINEVPAASRVPFRYTINVYRGCGHACSYCASGETPILMGDGRAKSLADVRPGDAVYGTFRRGNYRRYVVTEVLDHWSTMKAAYRVTLEDGTEIIASGDHRFLTDRGWKHVTGAGPAPLQRPHLTLNHTLRGTGRLATPPKDTPDYQRGYLCGMVRGDGTLDCHSYSRPGRAHRDGHRVRVALADVEALHRVRQYLWNHGIAADEFLFQEGVGNLQRIHAVRHQANGGLAAIAELIAWPTNPPDDWSKGFLAGIFDAEGSYSGGVLRITNEDPAIIDSISSSLRRLGLYSVVEPSRPNGCRAVQIPGGPALHLHFFHTVDPAITRKRTIEGQLLKNKSTSLRVVAIEPLGMELPLYDITTGTGDYIANGVVSHNCFARPSHTYLGLDSGRDFERVIIVKINAVEALEAELRSRRWGGDHIAMGTNTDPYQRCEGRYRLTRGVIEVLIGAGNPFSVLTKSPLVLRDVDLLTEAARRTDIAVNFSIGTLDADVWMASEPGTPRPRSRVEAIAALREAGVAAGVLVAPIIPGISDAPEQLEDVVKACLEAGAASISAILLHLRPGVKEEFLPWLERTRPDLLPHYQQLYPRAYASKAEQQRVIRLVQQLVERHGGPRRLTRSSTARALPPPTPRPQPEPAATQLSFEL